MPLDDSLNQNIRDVLAGALGVDDNFFRPANDNGPTGKLNELFGTVLISELDTVGVDASLYADNDIAHQLSVNVTGTRKVMASVQFFRTGSLTKANRLGGLLRLPSATTAMNALGLGLTKVGKVSNLSQVMDTFWEERAQLEIEFSVASVETSTIGTFAGIPITVITDTQSTSSEVKLDS